MPRHSRLARLQQITTLLVLASALGWLLLHWARSPLAAIAGALAIGYGQAWFLALEFIMMYWVCRGGPQPRPTPARLIAAWWAEAWHAPQVFFWRQPFRWRAIPDAQAPASMGRRGVVFVHGFVCNRGFWTPWLKHLRQQERAFVAVNLEPVFGSIDAYVPAVEHAVQAVTRATGMPPVLVCHSMGGLAARAWLRDVGDASLVHRIVTIGTPHRGTWLARFSRTRNGDQMRRGGAWLAQLERDEAARPRPPFTCWYSDSDNIVFPVETATLPGADNRLVKGAAHVQLAFVPEVIAGTLQLLEGE